MKTVKLLRVEEALNARKLIAVVRPPKKEAKKPRKTSSEEKALWTY